MKSLLTRLYVRATEEKGQALTEYAVILGLILVLSIGAIGVLGGYVLAVFNAINAAIAGA